MKSFIACICMLVATSGFVVLVADIHETLGKTNAAIVQMSKDEHDIAGQTQDVLKKVNDAAETAKDAAQKNAKYYDQASRQTAGTVKALRLFIDRSNIALNDKLFPQATDLLRTLNYNSGATFTGANAALAELQHSGQLLNQQLNDDRLRSIAANLDVTTEQLAQATAHANNTLESVDATTKFYKDKLMKPVTFWHKVGQTCLSIIIDAANVERAFF